MPVTIALSDYSKNYYNNSITQKGLKFNSFKGLKKSALIKKVNSSKSSSGIYFFSKMI